MKLYRYRPITPLLFKELHYQELYLAGYAELNDPLDMTAAVNFQIKKRDQIVVLANFIVRVFFKIYLEKFRDINDESILKILASINDKENHELLVIMLESEFKKH